MTPYRITRRAPWLPPWAAFLLGGFLIPASLAITATCARADNGVVVAKPLAYASHFHAYAQVAPIAVLKLRAATAGVVSGLDRLPGAQVPAGATLARLTGPAISAALANRRANLASAQAALTASRKSLLIQQQNQNIHLATRQVVAQAEAALAEARARLDDARSQLATLQSETTVQSPEAGQVLSAQAANGEWVSPGQVLLMLQPAHDLWLKAAFYGPAASAVRPGMTGRFQPADGGPSIPVKVRSVLGVVQTGGGTEVGCVPAAPAVHWHNGEAGSLVLNGASGTLPAVPTRALILDRGRWWVMLHTAQGDRPQAVEPGPVQGDETLIRQGLSPGAQIVVENPYLDFHRDFAQHYRPPD
jgi:RND family efflux transporter MFP subunit